jgi:hypothetical protein
MESVVVFSGKNIATILEERGCGHWTARTERVQNCEYLICVRNRREQWAATDLEHGTAFMIARIDGTTPSIYPGRIVITFEKYAKILVPDAWRLLTDGQRFPVAYDKTSEILRKLRIDPNRLHWTSIQGFAVMEKAIPYAIKKDTFAEAIAEAKASLAQSLGISENSIEIIIRT